MLSNVKQQSLISMNIKDKGHVATYICPTQNIGAYYYSNIINWDRSTWWRSIL